MVGKAVGQCPGSRLGLGLQVPEAEARSYMWVVTYLGRRDLDDRGRCRRGP